MKALGASLLLVAATSVGAQEYRLPFAERWFVAQAGDTLNVNHHMSAQSQWYGIDFAKVGGPSGRALTKTTGSDVSDFYCWGSPVLSPVDGEVVAVVDELPDNALGTKDREHPVGNHVVIKAAPDQYVFLAHFQSKSTTPKPGQRVARGQELGKCGNSGNSDFPHVHMHVQDSPVLGVGAGRNIVFSHISVELTGKQFTNVEWPLIRGLFVSNQ